MPKLTHTDLGLAAEMILDAHQGPSGEFKGLIVEGKPRIGKTVYAIKTLRDVYLQLHPEATMEEAYEWAIQNIHFKLEPFLTHIGSRQKEIREMLARGKIDWTKRIVASVLDDSSLYAGTDLYFQNQALYAAFSDTMTTIGSAASGVMITCPKYQALAKPIREFYNYYVVKITKIDEWRREAKIMEWYEGGRSRALKLREYGADEFTAHVPQAIYSKYLGPRLQLSEDAVAEALAASRVRAESVKAVAEGVLEQTPPPQTGKKRRRKRGKIPLYRPPESPKERRPLEKLREELGI